MTLRSLLYIFLPRQLCLKKIEPATFYLDLRQRVKRILDINFLCQDCQAIIRTYHRSGGEQGPDKPK